MKPYHHLRKPVTAYSLWLASQVGDSVVGLSPTCGTDSTSGCNCQNWMLLLSTVELRGKGGTPHSYPPVFCAVPVLFLLFETANGAWKDGLAAKSSGCSSTGWVSFSALTRWLTTVYNGSSRGSSALFWPPGVPDLHVICRHTCRQDRHPFK